MVKTKYGGVLQYLGEEPTTASTDFFATLARFLKEFSEAKQTVERVRRQEMKAAAAEAAREKKAQLLLERQRQPPDEDGLESGAGTTGARVRSTAGEVDEGEAELKENALLAVGGITIPKRRKKGKSLSVTGKVGRSDQRNSFLSTATSSSAALSEGRQGDAEGGEQTQTITNTESQINFGNIFEAG